MDLHVDTGRVRFGFTGMIGGLLTTQAWRRCDELANDGSKKPQTQMRNSYGHAMRMRAAMTYGFGRFNSRGTIPWRISDNGQWQGNPSISPQVSRYMVSLRKRKVCVLWLYGVR